MNQSPLIIRKIISLFLGLCLGCAIANATVYRATVSRASWDANNNYYKQGSELSENPGLVSVTLYKNAYKRKDTNTYTSLPGKEGDKIADYGTASINIRHDNTDSSNGSIIVINVNKK